MQKNLTQGPITKTLVFFALPMIGGNMLQQLYNIDDLSHIYPAGAVHGQRGGIFYPLWRGRYGKAP